MDFSHISLTQIKEEESKMFKNAEAAKLHLVLFAFFGINLFVSIVRTISTAPGTIPEMKEWDF